MEPQPHGGAEDDMDMSTSMLGRRPRDSVESPNPDTPAMGKQGKRPRGDAIANAPAADMSVVHEHAQ